VTQLMWLSCHYLLDDGMQACPHCEALTQGLYCTACGTRLQPEPRTCGQCHATGAGAFCAYCGTALSSATEEAIAEERFDWQAWARQLTPFLGGITPQEQALLDGSLR
jgi:hypothetical protein